MTVYMVTNRKISRRGRNASYAKTRSEATRYVKRLQKKGRKGYVYKLVKPVR